MPLELLVWATAIPLLVVLVFRSDKGDDEHAGKTGPPGIHRDDAK